MSNFGTSYTKYENSRRVMYRVVEILRGTTLTREDAKYLYAIIATAEDRDIPYKLVVGKKI